jgi:subtilisin family serine protease
MTKGNITTRARALRHVSAGAVLLSLSLLGCNDGKDAAKDPPSVAVAKQALEAKTYYYRRGKRVEVNLAPDQVALVAAQPGLRTAIQSLAQGFGATIVDVFQDSLYVLRVEKKLDRAGLEQLADALKKQGKKYITETGLAVYDDQRSKAPTLLSNQFIARFGRGVSAADIAALNAGYGVDVVGVDPYVQNQYLLQLKPGAGNGVLDMAARYEEDGKVDFAHPNFWRLHTTFDQTPFDPFLANQWHHRNTGASGGVVDADADTTWAWDFGYGSPDVVIGVVDQGVQLTHPDLQANIYSNPGETAGNGIDDDGNGLVDDKNGWNFQGCGASTLPCGSSDPNPQVGTDNHGTAVAGVAAARANNATGVAGSCPNCKIMSLRVHFPSLSDQTVINVFEYAANMGVNILNNSWGHTSPSSAVDTAVAEAIEDAADAGSMIFWAAGNGDSDGWCDDSYPSLNDSVMAVSSSTNLDKRVVEAAWGTCVDILAPSHRGYAEPYNGTLNVTTTDRSGATGYNSANPPPLACLAEPANTDYTNCFGGTSSATPLVAGIAGLIMSANGSLDRSAIQQLLQDTADKVVDSVADYNHNTGRSTPETHAYGRVNAYEAVRVAATAGLNARQNTDIFLRDNELDWGNATSYLGEQSSGVKFESPRTSIGHWRSRDIKVDAPPYETAPTVATYDAFVDQKPSLNPGDINKVYVRVRNRGHDAASDVDVKLMWTQFGTSLPAFPGDFWTSFPSDSASATNPWTSAQCAGGATDYCTIGSISYSGASVAGSGADAAQIAVFDMPAPTYDPAKANHYCLLAIANSPDDPVDAISEGIFAADGVTPNDNNVTHRNYTDLDTSVASSFEVRFYIRNPFDREMRTRVILSGDPKLLEATRIEGFSFGKVLTMKGQSEQLVTIKVTPNPDVVGDIELSQQNYMGNQFQTVGGLTLGIIGK